MTTSTDWFDNDTPQSLAPLTKDEISFLEQFRASERFYLGEEDSSNADLRCLELAPLGQKSKSTFAEHADFACKLGRCRSKGSSLKSFLEQRALGVEQIERDHDETVKAVESCFSSCQIITNRQDHLASLSEYLRSRLSYFSTTRSISMKLGSSIIVSNANLIAREILPQARECLVFMRSHSTYKEADSYANKLAFELIPKCLSILTNRVEECLSFASDTLITKSALTYDEIFPQVYGDFRLKLLDEIRSLVSAIGLSSDDLVETYLVRCSKSYVLCRTKLVLEPFRAQLKSFDQGNSLRHSIAWRIRQALEALTSICDNELLLVEEAFDSSISGLVQTQMNDSLFGQIAEAFSAVIRPQIIRTQCIESLADAVNALKLEPQQQQQTPNNHRFANFPLSVRNVLFELLQDAQERLLYRFAVYTKTEILQYSSSSADLMYPERLQLMHSIANKQRSGENYDLNGMWYPTVRRTLLCMSKLYYCIDDNSIFQAVSQEIAIDCLESLKIAADKIKTRSSEEDGLLFLLKHLLILREQTIPFNVLHTFSETKINLSKLGNALGVLVPSYDNQNNWSFLEFLTRGQDVIEETIVDSRSEVDKAIGNCCEQLIERWKASCQCDQLDSSEARSKAFYAVKEFVPILRSVLKLYLNDERLERVLFLPVRNCIINAFNEAIVGQTAENDSVSGITMTQIKEIVDNP